jgi:hypothetical protein
MRRRVGLSAILLLGAATLLIALALGNDMGSRVVAQVAGRIPQFTATPTPFPEPSGTDDPESQAAWKTVHVMAVATDPGFVDPRVTPPPPPPPPPRPATPSPSPKPTPRTGQRYTSPPLPIPIVSHEPGETSAPDPAPNASGGSIQPSP